MGLNKIQRFSNECLEDITYPDKPTSWHVQGRLKNRSNQEFKFDVGLMFNMPGNELGKKGNIASRAGIEINLEPGDMLIYSGCDLEHWREEFKGKNCAQVFLHYNKSSSKTAKENYLDKRPLLGLPPVFKKC